MEMEQTNVNHHRFARHFEIIITFIALCLLAFGLYEAAFGQTGGWDTYDIGTNSKINTNVQAYPVGSTTGSGTYDVGTNYNYNVDPNLQVYSATTGGTTTGTTGYYRTNWWDPKNNNTYGGGTGNTGTTTTGGTSGYQTGGTVSGGYYSTGGGYYYGSGLNDPDPYRTQGGYVPAKGSGIYGTQGIVEGGAVRTQGTTVQSGSGVFDPKSFNDGAAISTATQNNVSPQHCEFITKYHKFGDRGGDVPKIQQFLKDRGYYNGRIDGVYGISTFKAVRAFQKDYKDQILDPWDFAGKERSEGTGITNVSTKYAINKMVGCPDPATIVPKTGKVLNY